MFGKSRTCVPIIVVVIHSRELLSMKRKRKLAYRANSLQSSSFERSTAIVSPVIWKHVDTNSGSVTRETMKDIMIRH